MSTAPPILLVMIDGCADRPWSLLEGRTPLQAALTLHLDRFASRAATGILHPLGPGRAPGTELAHFALLGHPAQDYPGRAVFEAVGAGIPLPPSAMAMHTLLATVRRESDGSLTVMERYPTAPPPDIEARFADLDGFEHGGLRVRVHHLGGVEGIIIVEPANEGGLEPSSAITDTDSHIVGSPVGTVQPLHEAADHAAARATADALNAWLEHAWTALGANPGSECPASEQLFPLLKWPGRRRALTPFRELTGMNGVIVSSSRIFAGLSLELGLEHRLVPYDREDLAFDMSLRLKEGLTAIAAGADFVLVHTKAADEAGHTKDPQRKRRALEELDDALAGLEDRVGMPDDTIVVVTGDHGTPAGTAMIHSGDPVPLAILADAVARDAVTTFDESACAAGSLGHIGGSDLMPMLLNLRGTARYLSGRLTPVDTLHTPSDYEPFRIG